MMSNDEQIVAVKALLEQWTEVPDYTVSDYDRGRVDQRHAMVEQLLEVLL